MSRCALATLSTLLLLASLAACGDDEPGSTADAGAPSLQFLVEAEDSIRDGVSAGEGVEDIADGWSISWQNYLMVIGAVEVTSVLDENDIASEPERFAIDVLQVPSAGLPLWAFESLEGGRWNVGYAIGTANEPVSRHSSVEEADFDTITSEKLTYLLRGTLSSPEGQSCPPAGMVQVGARTDNGNQNSRDEPCYDAPQIALEIAIDADAVYGPCEVDEIPGVAVPAGGSTSAALTIHGDHLFFNGFPEGDEGGVMRRAQWWADADLDLDGTVTQAELESLTVSDLAEFDAGYQFGGAPTGSLDSLWDYVRAQLRTQGHFQGEGECALAL